jgi:flavin reductase (DIM6/NTAB) family NADH-FMN oxidoreductase RutF
MRNSDLGVAMKLGMRRLASGVCVLSTQLVGGERFAMTVSSVTSVSDNPASLLVCVNKHGSMEGHLATQGSPFAISILASGQQAISNRCAGLDAADTDRFSLGDWQQGFDGLPYLADAQATFFCRSDMVNSYGTHHIIVGRIFEVVIGGLTIDPLIYVDGDYEVLQRL